MEKVGKPAVEDGGGAVPGPAGGIGAHGRVVDAGQSEVERAIQVRRDLRHHPVAPHVRPPAHLSPKPDSQVNLLAGWQCLHAFSNLPVYSPDPRCGR